MTSLLFGISLSAVLSLTSLLVVLARISPLLSPVQAIPAFIASLFLSVGSITTLLLYAFWKHFPLHTWDEGKLISISLRQGVFTALTLTLIVIFWMAGILSIWTGALIVTVFALIEAALNM